MSCAARSNCLFGMMGSLARSCVGPVNARVRSVKCSLRRQALQLRERRIGYAGAFGFRQIDEPVQPAGHEHGGDLSSRAVFADVLFWGEAQACDVAVDGA